MILSPETEVKILGCLYRIQQFADVVAEHLQPNLFSMAIDQNISKIALDQFKNHRSLATEYIYGYEVKKLIDNKTIKEDEQAAYIGRFLEILEIDTQDWEYVLDEQLVPFIKNRLYKKLTEDMIRTLMPRNRFEEIDKRFEYIKNIGVNEQAAIIEQYSDDAIEQRHSDRIREVEMLNQGQGRIKYGIRKLDEISGGGIHTEKDRLIVFAAPPKVGKSMSLLHFANNAAQQGFNVAYFTYETAISVLQDRMDASVSGIKTNDVIMKMNQVKANVKAKNVQGEVFFIKYPTGTADASTVKRDVMRIEQRKDKKIDLVVVDYLDISKKDKTQKDDNEMYTAMWESYRRCAEELDCPMLSATQISSKATGKSVITSDKVLGSTGKLASVDALFIISGTDKDLKAGKIYMTSSVCRNIEKCTWSIKSDYSRGKFFQAMDQDEIF